MAEVLMSRLKQITAILITVSLAGTASAGEFKIQPSITVSEEYTDNVFGTNADRVDDFITRILPGIFLDYKAPVLEADLNYRFDYRYYARNSRSSDTTHDLAIKGHLTAVDNLLFLDVRDQYRRVSLDVTRDVTQESLFVNQSDQNIAFISPYLTLQPGARTKVKTGYRFLDTRYFNAQSDAQGIDKTDHSGFLEITHELSSRWSATCGYTFTHEDAETNDFDQHQPFAGFRYEYADKSFLFGQAGYTWIRYSDGHNLNNVYWNAGFSHAFATVTTTINTGVKYDEDPLRNITQETFVTGNLEKRLFNGSLALALNYSEFTLADTDVLQTRKYGGVVQGRYEFTPRLNGNLAFTAEKYDQPLLDSYTRRLLVNSGLSYLLSAEMTISLNHIFVDYYSPDIAPDNKEVNRIILEVRKVF